MRRRVVSPVDVSSVREREGPRWLVEHLVDGRVRISIDRDSFMIQHTGEAGDVMPRVAADSSDAAAIDEARREPPTARPERER
jgi:hypothetical protein